MIAPDAKYCPTGQPYPPKPFDSPAGWKGGFEESNPEFSYPVRQPDLSSIPVTTNLANIDKLTRQMKVKWPEFSWQMVPGDETTRTYVKFAEYISRYGYDDEGRIWSIICPQQGATAGSIGEFNVEVTVTGVRGWVDEPKREVAAELGVMGQIWFTTDKEDNPNLKALANFMDKYMDFPFTKSKSIRLQTNEVGNPNQPLFRNEIGMSKDFKTPSFAQHWDEAYIVSNLSVEIGAILEEKDVTEMVDDFNQMILNIFNIGSGNMLKKNNVLTWNIWTTGPEIVDQTEWAGHAEKWRQSFDTNHTQPIGIETRGKTFYYDGAIVPSPFSSGKYDSLEITLLKEFFDKHLHDEETLKQRFNDPEDPFTKVDHNILNALGVIKKSIF